MGLRLQNATIYKRYCDGYEPYARVVIVNYGLHAKISDWVATGMFEAIHKNASFVWVTTTPTNHTITMENEFIAIEKKVATAYGWDIFDLNKIVLHQWRKKKRIFQQDGVHFTDRMNKIFNKKFLKFLDINLQG